MSKEENDQAPHLEMAQREVQRLTGELLQERAKTKAANVELERARAIIAAKDEQLAKVDKAVADAKADRNAAQAERDELKRRVEDARKALDHAAKGGAS